MTRPHITRGMSLAALVVLTGPLWAAACVVAGVVVWKVWQ